MSAESFTKQLHNLSYKDMMQIAEYLVKHLNTAVKPEIHATAMAALLSTIKVEGMATSNEEAKMIGIIFRRKRAVMVTPVLGGYTTMISEMPSTTATSSNLRDALGMTLDQAVALQALTGKK